MRGGSLYEALRNSGPEKLMNIQWPRLSRDKRLLAPNKKSSTVLNKNTIFFFVKHFQSLKRKTATGKILVYRWTDRAKGCLCSNNIDMFIIMLVESRISQIFFPSKWPRWITKIILNTNRELIINFHSNGFYLST